MIKKGALLIAAIKRIKFSKVFNKGMLSSICFIGVCRLLNYYVDAFAASAVFCVGISLYTYMDVLDEVFKTRVDFQSELLEKNWLLEEKLIDQSLAAERIRSELNALKERVERKEKDG